MHTPSTLQSYIAGRWQGESAHQPLHSALDNQLIFHTHAEKIDFDEALTYARKQGVRELMQPRLPEARPAPESPGDVPHGAQGRAVRDLAPDRRHPPGQLGRRRRRHRHPVRLCQHGLARAAVVERAARRPGHGAGQARRLCRHPHPGAARRRGGAHQRLQLPDLGPAREIRAQLPGRHALHRQAGHRHQLPDPRRGQDDDGIRPGAGRQPAAGDRLDRRPAGPPDRLRRRHLHRFGRHRRQAARQPQPDPRGRALHRRSRLAQLRHPGAGRDAGRRGIRPVRQGSRARDDRQGRPEMHGDPPHHRAGTARRRLGERLRARLAKIVVGNPKVEGVRMGALASMDQHRDVSERVEMLARGNEVLFSARDGFKPVGEGAAMAPSSRRR
jgi:hypothetical protein